MKRFIRFTHIKTYVGTFYWLFKLNFRVSALMSSLYIITSVLQSTVGIFSYYATAKVGAELIKIIAGNGSTKTVWVWFLLVGLSSLITNAMYRISKILEREAYYLLSMKINLDYLRKLSELDIQDYARSSTRNIINRLNDGMSWQVPNAAFDTILLTQSFINTLFTIVTVGVLAWWLIPLFTILLIPAILYESKISSISWFVSGERGDERHVYFGLYNLFTQVKRQFELRALALVEPLLHRIESMSTKFKDRERQKLHSYNPLAFLIVITQVVRELGAQGWLISQVISKKLTMEQYLFYISMVFRLDGAISGTFSTMARMQEEMKFSEDYIKLMKRQPKITDLPNAITLDEKVPSIELRNASFKYPRSDRYIFKNINLIIEPGTKIAIVGENGAGKSTLIKLLLRFYKLTSGELLINGINIESIKIESLLSQVAVLFQDFNQYQMTAKDNITIAGKSNDDKLLNKVIKMSGAEDFIQTYPEGINTYLDPSFTNGVEPSGGQWQRIALARAFYRQANMIILDEPTSAIDAKAEYEIFNNIFKEHDGKTAIIVSHRFSTVRKADRIIVLDDGQIIEDGTHEALMKHDGVYSELFTKQAEGYR